MIAYSRKHTCSLFFLHTFHSFCSHLIQLTVIVMIYLCVCLRNSVAHTVTGQVFFLIVRRENVVFVTVFVSFYFSLRPWVFQNGSLKQLSQLKWCLNDWGDCCWTLLHLNMWRAQWELTPIFLNLKTISAMISLTPCPGLNSVLSKLDISTVEVFGQELLGPLTALGYLNDFLFILLCDRIFQVGVKYSYRLTFRWDIYRRYANLSRYSFSVNPNHAYINHQYFVVT